MHVFVQESLATELQQSVTFGGRPTSYILLMLDTKSNWRAVVYMYYDNVPYPLEPCLAWHDCTKWHPHVACVIVLSSSLFSVGADGWKGQAGGVMPNADNERGPKQVIFSEFIVYVWLLFCIFLLAACLVANNNYLGKSLYMYWAASSLAIVSVYCQTGWTRRQYPIVKHKLNIKATPTNTNFLLLIIHHYCQVKHMTYLQIWHTDKTIVLLVSRDASLLPVAKL